MRGQQLYKKQKNDRKTKKTADKSIFRWNYPLLCVKIALCEEAGRKG